LLLVGAYYTGHGQQLPGTPEQQNQARKQAKTPRCNRRDGELDKQSISKRGAAPRGITWPGETGPKTSIRRPEIPIPAAEVARTDGSDPEHVRPRSAGHGAVAGGEVGDGDGGAGLYISNGGSGKELMGMEEI
jgi:hypothetical protein